MIREFVNAFISIDRMETIVLNNYILEQGAYFIITKDNKIEGPRIVIKGQTQEDMLYEWIKKADYYSQIAGMRKELDIYSNNYLSFFMKIEKLPEIGQKDQRITNEQLQQRIEEHYQTMIEKEVSQKMGEMLGTLDLRRTQKEKLLQAKQTIQEKLPEMIELMKQAGIESGSIKVFFEESIERYTEEYKKYMLPILFDENKEVEINGEIFELYTSNLDKTYLSLKTEDVRICYRITIEEGLLLKRAFDWVHCILADRQITNKIYIPADFRFDRELDDEQNLKKSKSFIYLIPKEENDEVRLQSFELVNLQVLIT